MGACAAGRRNWAGSLFLFSITVQRDY